MTEALRIPGDGVTLDADLTAPTAPERPGGLVLFAHGSGSSRHSPRNRHVAERLQAAGLATLLADLLTPEEERLDTVTRELRFDIGLLARRLGALVAWARTDARTEGLPIGLFGASTGAAAALMTAAALPDGVRVVVSRGGRPDLAGDFLWNVEQPTLLIVGGADPAVLDLNRRALARLAGEARLEVVPGATHLFEEPGALDAVARLAATWFTTHLDPHV
ncbi:dienelactone hydrolase family protein [Nonomuraea sp. NPDC050383]|uniref:dienelactone hydrolase family protein n=1 Tax=Nonomuraea sp. NPDC050383 TaxID=3364362 RepID=UPI003793FDA8